MAFGVFSPGVVSILKEPAFPGVCPACLRYASGGGDKCAAVETGDGGSSSILLTRAPPTKYANQRNFSGPRMLSTHQ